jgi:hypothetical protein
MLDCQHPLKRWRWKGSSGDGVRDEKNCSCCHKSEAWSSSGRYSDWGRLHLKRDGTRAETRFRLSAKRKSPFKSAGASVQLTAGSRGARISGSNAGYTVFRGSAKSTGYPICSAVSPSLSLPCVTVCHQLSTGLYHSKNLLISGDHWSLKSIYP